MKLLKFAACALVATHMLACVASSDTDNTGDNDIASDETSSQESELSGGVPAGTKLTLTAAANFRKQASTSAPIIQLLKAGTTVVSVSTAPSNGYYEVALGGVRGFVYGAYLSSGAPVPAQSRVNGLWVAHSSILTEAGIQAVVDTAKAAHINTLYPAVLRYSCAYYETTAVPRCADSCIDNLGILVKVAKAANIQVVPWVERIIQVRPGTGNDDKTESVPLNADFPVLDVARADVRSSLLGAMLDAAKYDVAAVQVDDHLGYDAARLSVAQKSKYEAKLSEFAGWLVREFKAKSGKKFELAPHPMPFARTRYLTNWTAWSGVDRVVIQCYRSTGAAVISDANCRTGRAGSGLGVATTANGVTLSDADIASVAAQQVARKEAFVLFHAGALMQRPSLVVALAKALPQ